MTAFSRGWDAFVNTLGRALVRGSTTTRLIAWSLENLKSQAAFSLPHALEMVSTADRRNVAVVILRRGSQGK